MIVTGVTFARIFLPNFSGAASLHAALIEVDLLPRSDLGL
jgi:hypothetical protein